MRLVLAAGAVHGIGLLAFAVLMAIRNRLGGDASILRVYRSFGALFGLSLGAFWLGLALLWPDRYNPGAVGLLDAYSLPSGLARYGAAALFVYWINYVALEIWTLEPSRLLDKDGVITDPPAYAACARRVAVHLWVNALLFNLGWALLTL